jgi:mannose/cellobiose epimerase-like protein (N-acyl-D-glucosamine 2-epimerase family)
VVERHFLDAEGRVVDTLSPDLREAEAYRGANSSMHMVEALLAAADATGNDDWRARALRIAEHLVHEVARGSSYLLPEHFSESWTPLPDYNVDDPADPFRPYGCTPGHLIEWARLLLTLEAATDEPPPWLLADALALFDRAVEIGWEADGNPGFVYTVDWDGAPVVALRMHWVHAEALAAAAVFERRTGEPRYGELLRAFDGYIAEHLVDLADGSWRHELDERSRPSSTVWRGKPDVYHAYQALLLTRLPYSPTLAAILSR